MAYALGWPIEEVSIIQTLDGRSAGHVTYFIAEPNGPDDADAMRKVNTRVVICLSGMIAEEFYTGVLNRHGGGDDLDNIMGLQSYWNHQPNYVTQMYADTKKLLKNYRQAVWGFADILQSSKLISGTISHMILRQWLGSFKGPALPARPLNQRK